jgi:hypothetical protein
MEVRRDNTDDLQGYVNILEFGPRQRSHVYDARLADEEDRTE